jgi:cell division septum initiation protein DivIVA
MSGIQSVSITPEQLRGASFSVDTDGYDRDEVRSLLAAAADALELAWREKHDLTAGLSAEDSEISSRAVLLLSNAQRIADDAVAEAEAYSKDLIETARKQYREIVERAQQVAHSIEREAAAERRASEPERAAAPAAPAPAAAAPAAAASATGQTAAWTGDQSPLPAFATDDLAAAGPASPDDVVRARQFTRMAAAQAHSLLESIERELGRLGSNPPA